MSHVNIVLNIIPTLYEGYIVSVHKMVMENRPVDEEAERYGTTMLLTNVPDIYSAAQRSDSRFMIPQQCVW